MASAVIRSQGRVSRLLREELRADADDRRPARTRRDWVVDSAFFALALLVGFAAFTTQVRTGDWPAWAIAAGALGGLAACGALWFRTRWPVALTVAVLPIATVSSFAGPAGLILFFTVAVHRRFAVVAWIGAIGVPALAVSTIVQPLPRTGGQPSLQLSLLLLVLVHVTVAACGMYIRARRLLLSSLRERAERAEAAQQDQAERAREHERARIAREMHDVLAHRISLLSLHAGSLEFRPDAPPEEIERAAGVIRASAHAALQDLREVIGVLRQEPAGEASERPQPTLADLPALLEESREAGMSVRAALALDGAEAAPELVGRSAYRIVQEGLTNARKHARDTTVDVAVRGEAGAGLAIELRNPLPVGGRASEIPGAGSGLIGLAERASLAGGRLEHGRTDAGEYRLEAWLPWPA